MRESLISAAMLLAAVAVLAACGAEQAVKKGDKFFALGEYYDAAAQYRKAYQQTPVKERSLRGRRALLMAECYRRINYSQKALAAYNNVLRYGQGDSLTHLYIAQQLMKNGNYKEAARHFQQALDTASHMPQELRPLAAAGLLAAQQAPLWKEQGSTYIVRREALFNSRRADYSPVLAGENWDQLFLTSTRNQAKGDELSGITGTKNADIFMAQKDEKGKWQRPEVIDSELNSDDDEGACTLSADGRTMFLTVCRTDPEYPRYATIATSQRTDAAWAKAQEFVLSRDTLSAFAHPAVSPDGRWLYFTSNMPGGMGGYDLWRIQLEGGGTVGGVENLGATVNTAGDEMFPTFRPNGDLYFSSNGHPGMGGLDIFVLPADGSQLEHPGFPLNSQGDDFGMTFEGAFNRGFFSSNRGDGKGWDHIYSFEKPEVIQTVKGWVYEQDGYELPAALVYMVGDDGTNLKLNVKGDGSFTQEIKPGVNYIMLGTCKGYLNHQEQFRADSVTESKEHVLQFPLASISAPVMIDNIFFDFNRATLRPESKESLDRLVTLLQENPNVTIELSAHCDYKGPAEYNKRLSQQRAEAVVDYLTEHGIAADRLRPVGYGKEKPKTVRRKLTETYPFLKEGDVLTEEFIKTLTDEQQEQCNQLNRRTEFIVLRTTYGLTDGNQSESAED